MTYFIECTHTYQTRLNSGIQRVVRNIVRSSMTMHGAGAIVPVVPVVLDNGKFVAIGQDIPYPAAAAEATSARGKVLAALKNQLKCFYRDLRALAAKLIPYRPFVVFLYAPTNQWGLGRILLLPLQLLKRSRPAPQREAIQLQKGDVLILLDSSWYLDMWKAIDAGKRDGAQVVTVIYDLIPHTHPQFCTPALAQTFKKWLKNAVERSDAVIAISQTIAADFARELPRMTGIGQLPARLSWFWLGSELDGAQSSGKPIDPALLRLVESRHPTYLYVSTIEPRKNHGYALDAFEILWRNGVQAQFVIVGRIGWKGDEFIARVQRHPQFGKQLFMFNSVEDKELAYLYDEVHGLIFTSVTEGFGLPVVEGLQRGLPVFASDLPVFHEIGRQGVSFVDLAAPTSLADALAAHIGGGAQRLAEPVQWLSWQESTQQFFTRIEECLADRTDRREVLLEALPETQATS